MTKEELDKYKELHAKYQIQCEKIISELRRCIPEYRNLYEYTMNKRGEIIMYGTMWNDQIHRIPEEEASKFFTMTDEELKQHVNKILCKKQVYTFDFSWIERMVKKWVKSTDEDLQRMIEVGLPCGLTFYDGDIFTHIGEKVNDFDDYKRQRKAFCDNLVKKYAKKSC